MTDPTPTQSPDDLLIAIVPATWLRELLDAGRTVVHGRREPEDFAALGNALATFQTGERHVAPRLGHTAPIEIPGEPRPAVAVSSAIEMIRAATEAVTVLRVRLTAAMVEVKRLRSAGTSIVDLGPSEMTTRVVDYIRKMSMIMLDAGLDSAYDEVPRDRLVHATLASTADQIEAGAHLPAKSGDPSGSTN